MYGMKIEAILDRPADNICLDHLARVLVDVHQVTPPCNCGAVCGARSGGAAALK
jgi:hypothetical protein